jgi:predicted nucleotide-binding protein
MTKRSAQHVEIEEEIFLRVSLAQAREKINHRIEQGTELLMGLRQARLNDEHKRQLQSWDEYNCEMLKKLFTTPRLGEDANYAGFSTIINARGDDAMYLKGYEDKLGFLRSLEQRLDLYETPQTTPNSRPAIVSVPHSKKVFIVHGHDEAAKHDLERFISVELKLEPIVLHRQADEGLTVIEKFEKHSDVGYAFILLTPDELSMLANEKAKPEDHRKYEIRARPNVIFEFGFFVGKLGRSKVCCLHKGHVDLPSDLGGTIYKDISNGIDPVAFSIVKELRAAGYIV